MRHFLLLLTGFMTLSAEAPADTVPAVVLHESLAGGLASGRLDLKNPVAVFAAVFATLPAEVRVLPTENYYYWQMFCDGREIRGNIRLPSGQREKGVLCVGYAEYREFAGDGGPEPEISEAKYFSRADGIAIQCQDNFTAVVSFRGKSVTFHLNRIPQAPPANLRLASGEVFLERTHDESGCRFLLIYNKPGKYFLWVLDEEKPAPEHWHPLADNAVLGRRTGFIFWIDREAGERKVLAAVRQASVDRNDWFDGPFDQLADNYAAETRIRHYIEEAIPEYRGRIDQWGYILDSPESKRVALNNYATWSTIADAKALLARLKMTRDPRRFISQSAESSR